MSKLAFTASGAACVATFVMGWLNAVAISALQ
jgi:hypothetical protein